MLVGVGRLEDARLSSEFLNVPEVAARLRVTVQTVQRWLRRGKLKGIQLSGRAGWRIPLSEVERFERGVVAEDEEDEAAA